MELPRGAKTLVLPSNPAIRVMAVTAAKVSAVVKPAQPLYDVLGTAKADQEPSR